jgi:hypothetical protein
MRHEAFDLGVVIAALRTVGKRRIEDWVRASPTSAFARRAWFFFETFTGDQLDLEPATTGNYVDALSPDRFVTGQVRYAARQRVRDNLLGVAGFSPTVRRTPRLLRRIAERWDLRVRAVASEYDPVLFARAATYLYTKESKSSYAIEGESPKASRLDRFVQVLRGAGSFETTSATALIGLQAAAFDARFASPGWRTTPIYVGETIGFNTERIHYVGPRPEDLSDLMGKWARATDRLIDGPVDPVVVAAVASFGFVFLHPLPDGNGRVHRFLIHNILARLGFTPEGVLFPVSAPMLRDRGGYDRALETFSTRLLDCVSWDFEPDGTFVPEDVNSEHYRYVDLTPLVEYLYDQVAEATEEDLKEELVFLDAFDRAFLAVQQIVDMPDREISLLTRLCMQNGGTLALARRSRFDRLTDGEIALVEVAVRRAMTRAQGRD